MKFRKIIFGCISFLFFGFSILTLNSCGKEHVHDWYGKVLKEASCTNNGEIIYVCTGCDETKTEIIIAKGHTEVIDEEVAVTCTTDGLTEGKHCSKCNEVLIAQQIVPAKGHTEVIDEEVEATCTETGLTQGSHCDVCKKVLTPQETISVIPHDYSENICNGCGLNYYETILTFKEVGNGYSISYKGNDDLLVIPSMYNNKPIISIEENAFSHSPSLKSIIIPKTITIVENNAFKYCDSLEVVCYEGTIENWCNISFGGSSSNPMNVATEFYMLDKSNKWCEITQIEIPSSISKINDYAFYGFNNLTKITLPNSITSIGTYAFSDCYSIMSIVVPSSVTYISEYAFSGCVSLVIYCEVESQPEQWASNWFSNRPIYWGIDRDSIIEKNNIQYKIQSGNAIVLRVIETANTVIVPQTITNNSIVYDIMELGKYSFYKCNTLVNIAIESNITSINDDTFYGCSLLTYLSLPDTVTQIGTHAFYGCSSLEIFTIPNNVNTIGDRAFYNCKSLKNISIPNSVKEIGYGAFEGCSSLTTVSMSNKITSIKSSTFYNCSSLLDITLPNSVTNIGDYVFYNCKSLQSINIPINVSSIGNCAFYNCSSLCAIIIRENVLTIGYNTFYNCKELIIYSETTSKPDGWDLTWNGSSKVYWGNEWKQDEYGNIIVDVNNTGGLGWL